MEGGTSREGKGTGICLFCQLRPDCGRLLLHVVALSAWREHCETLVWCEGKHNCLNSRYDSQRSSFLFLQMILLHSQASYFLPLEYSITTKDLNTTVYLFCKLSCTFVCPMFTVLLLGLEDVV